MGSSEHWSLTPQQSRKRWERWCANGNDLCYTIRQLLVVVCACAKQKVALTENFMIMPEIHDLQQTVKGACGPTSYALKGPTSNLSSLKARSLTSYVYTTCNTLDTNWLRVRTNLTVSVRTRTYLLTCASSYMISRGSKMCWLVRYKKWRSSSSTFEEVLRDVSAPDPEAVDKTLGSKCSASPSSLQKHLLTCTCHNKYKLQYVFYVALLRLFNWWRRE